MLMIDNLTGNFFIYFLLEVEIILLGTGPFLNVEDMNVSFFFSSESLRYLPSSWLAFIEVSYF